MISLNTILDFECWVIHVGIQCALVTRRIYIALAKIKLRPKSREFSFGQNIQFNCQIVWTFCIKIAQIFKTIWQLRHMVWTNEISHDLSLRFVSDDYPILQQPLGAGCSLSNKCCPFENVNVFSQANNYWSCNDIAIYQRRYVFFYNLTTK